MLLLKGTIAWTAAVASFTVLAIFEAIAIAYSISMTVRFIKFRCWATFRKSF